MLIDLLSSSNGSKFADTISSFKEPVGYTQQGWIPVFGVFAHFSRAVDVDSLLFGFRWTVPEALQATEKSGSRTASVRGRHGSGAERFARELEKSSRGWGMAASLAPRERDVPAQLRLDQLRDRNLGSGPFGI